jgi:uncharacterized protein involved in exopolysaccharide biosynthesis
MLKSQLVPQRLLLVLDWLTWGRITALAGLGAVITGLTVFVFVPIHYTSSTTFLVKEGAASMAGLPPELAAAVSKPANASQLYMEFVLNSRHLRKELIAQHQLERRLSMSPQKAQEWLHKATNVSTIGKRPMRDGIGTTIAVTIDGASRLKQWQGKPEPFTHSEAKELCAQLAHDYVAAMEEYLVAVNIKTARGNQQFIEERLKEVRTALSETEDRLQQMRTQYLFLEPTNQYQMAVDSVSTARTEYAAGEARSRQLASSLASSRSQLSREAAERISSQIQERNPTIEMIEKELATLQTDYQTELATGKSPQHPDVVVIKTALQEIKELQKQLPQQVFQQVTVQPNPLYDKLLLEVATTEVQLAGEQARQRQLQQQVRAAENSLRDLPAVAREYASIQERYKLQSELVVSLSRQLEMAKLEVNRDSVSSFDVLDEAEPPERKSGPSSVVNAVVAFVVVFMLLGLGWAARHGLFVDYMTEPPAAEK